MGSRQSARFAADRHTRLAALVPCTTRAFRERPGCETGSVTTEPAAHARRGDRRVARRARPGDDGEHRVPWRALRRRAGVGPLPARLRRARAQARPEPARRAAPARGRRAAGRPGDVLHGARRRRRSSPTAPTSRSAASCARCSPARSGGASCSPSRAPAPTSPGSATRAVRDGDEWIVNGQKVWNTLAHLADCGMLVTRTDPDAAQAQGHDVLRARHALARRRGPPAAPDHRRGRVQRGVPHRRAGARRRPDRRRGRGLAGRR